MLDYLILIIIAFVCGSIASRLAGSSRKGCITSVVLGFIGALIGTLLVRKLGVGDLFWLKGVPILWSIVGAALFIGVLNFMSGGKGK